jgi:hypothetical protein
MTQRHEQEIISALERAGQFRLPEASVERDLDRVRQLLASERRRRNIWRTIAQNRWTRLTAVAAVFVIVCVPFAFLMEPAPAAARLLAQVAHNMEKLTWAKIITESYAPGKEEPVSVDVHWTDVKNKRVFAVYDRKYIHLMDYTLRQWSIYRPETNDMIITRLEGEWVSPSGAIQEYIRRLQKEGIEVTPSEEMHEGREVIVLQFAESLNYLQGSGPATNMMMNGRHVKTMRHRLVIDKQDHLLGATEITYLDPDGNVIVVQKSRSEPIRTGPTDVYELGVPKDVTIVNKVPDERVQQVRKSIATHASRFLDTYIAVITEARMENGQERITEGMVVFRRAKELRVDVYRRLYSQPDHITPLYRSELDASLTRLKSYWPEGENWGIRSVRLYDGLWQYVLEVKDDNLVAWDKQRRPDGDAYATDDVEEFAWQTLWWLNEPEHMYEDDYSRTHGLIAMELTTQWQGYRLPKRQVAYIDPQKDYICQRFIDEELFDAPWQEDKEWMNKAENKGSLRERRRVRDVTEYGQTSAGQWYPKVIAETGHELPYDRLREDVAGVIRIHLLTEHPEFPEGVFDPDRLPSVTSPDSSR